MGMLSALLTIAEVLLALALGMFLFSIAIWVIGLPLFGIALTCRKIFDAIPGSRRAVEFVQRIFNTPVW